MGQLECRLGVATAPGLGDSPYLLHQVKCLDTFLLLDYDTEEVPQGPDVLAQ